MNSQLKQLVDFTSNIPNQTSSSMSFPTFNQPNWQQFCSVSKSEQVFRKSSELALGNPVSLCGKDEKQSSVGNSIPSRSGKKRKRIESQQEPRVDADRASFRPSSAVPVEVSDSSSDVDLSLSDESMNSLMKEMSCTPPKMNSTPPKCKLAGTKPRVVRQSMKESNLESGERERKIQAKLAFLSREFKRITERFAYLPTAAIDLRKKLDDVANAHNKVVTKVLSQNTQKSRLWPHSASQRVGLISSQPYPKIEQPQVLPVHEGPPVFSIPALPHPIFSNARYGDNLDVFSSCALPGMKHPPLLQRHNALPRVVAKPYQQRVVSGPAQQYPGGNPLPNPHIKDFSHDFDLPPMIERFPP